MWKLLKKIFGLVSSKPTNSHTPTLGRIVFYVLTKGDQNGQSQIGVSRPAVITGLPGPRNMIDLTVFPNELRDSDVERSAKDVPYSEGGEPGTWHW